ncbi:hypothetical protein [Burkholderia ubonensis]|uniref:hypothetical protein n=1 Tax=Burkholderia ubonensis TaxID=101571 RepID=UPI0007553006|nr:hypothetical protein [Burkholderia ubonensis]KVU18267.1 hypothetical protein WK64_07710 [Burkholderia ubonensis]
MEQTRHTTGQAWLQRAIELATARATANFEYGELGSDCTATESADAYARTLAADLELEAHLRFASEAFDALHLVASKTVLTSGIRAIVDAALAKAGDRAPEPVRHITVAGVDR